MSSTDVIDKVNAVNFKVVGAKVPRGHNSTLESIKYVGGDLPTLRLLDQRLLPSETAFVDIRTVHDVWTAIREMKVRGAPAIAVSAALGIAVDLCSKYASSALSTVEDIVAWLEKSLDYVASSRPTAVNLFNAVTHMKERVHSLQATEQDAASMVRKFVDVTEALYHHDVRCNEGIMQHGASHILAAAGGEESKVRILTICNTGALATSRYGTALGVVRQLGYNGNLEMVFALETRPWNQGARLTVYECVQENFPVTLLCDSGASYLMSRTKIHAVVVGADRICRNGDTANKIGTYNLAVAAAFHHVPFYVAAPTSTLDPKTASGDLVVVEERETSEITHNVITKQRCVADGPTLKIWNPVFDITPAELITGIITENGVVLRSNNPPFYEFLQ